LSSSGVHSNGFSLVRKIITDNNLDLNRTYDTHFTETLGNVLLTPTTIYVKAILELLETITVKGMCHITGGGFYENVPRMFVHNKQLGASFNASSWQKPIIYNFLQETGHITEKEIFNVFNMGIGFMIVLTKDNVSKALEILNKFHTTQVIGEVTNTGLIEIV
jgi:phosphoribosylformylglycinamidine cyclo-ligase